MHELKTEVIHNALLTLLNFKTYITHENFRRKKIRRKKFRSNFLILQHERGLRKPY